MLHLHRYPVPATHPPRLPAHLLRLVSERMVCLASHLGRREEQPQSTPVYLPIMPRIRARDQGGLEAEYPARGVLEGEPGSSQE